MIALTNQGRIKKAAKVFAEYRPAVRSRDEAEVWLRAHATLRWNERIAMEAYSLAERFDDDPQLCTALLGHIVFSTHGVGDNEAESAASGQSDIDDELDELDDDELEERRALAQAVVGASNGREVGGARAESRQGDFPALADLVQVRHVDQTPG